MPKIHQTAEQARDSVEPTQRLQTLAYYPGLYNKLPSLSFCDANLVRKAHYGLD